MRFDAAHACYALLNTDYFFKYPCCIFKVFDSRKYFLILINSNSVKLNDLIINKELEMLTSRLLQSVLLSTMTALIIACGGGGGGGISGSTTPSLLGVAAIGLALANASVTLKDSTGKTETTTTDESGNFNFNNVSSFTPPLMLQVKGSAAGLSYVLHSLMTSAPAQGTNTLNVTPTTDAITTQTLGSDPEVTFNDPVKIKSIDPQKLADTKAKL